MTKADSCTCPNTTDLAQNLPPPDGAPKPTDQPPETTEQNGLAAHTATDKITAQHLSGHSNIVKHVPSKLNASG